jgi:hypothetical protein
MSNVIRRCHVCGKGQLRPVAKAGRRTHYKNLELEIPADIKIPTCDNCGSQGFDRQTAVALDDGLEKGYREVLRKLWDVAIAKIQKKTSMRRVEQLLGLSEGYLSKVSNGRSDPSAELVAHLMSFANDVVGRTREVESMWKSAERLTKGRVGGKRAA